MTDPGVLASGRFTIQRRIGAGGMGVVYEAFDRDRGHVVALKKLLGTDATAIYRLKTEFRALADVVHPNLVRLYELVGEGDEWFFTMELVDGVDFLHAIRGRSLPPPREDATTERSTLISDTGRSLAELALKQDDDTHETQEPQVEPVAIDFKALRRILRQLGEGVAALHDAGKLHRDLKPSNVLVTPAGRVVILDFGLATDVSGFEKKITFGGTPAYMAPEQIADLPASEASDCYAIGVMLYEALTGTLPFTGNFYAMLMQKRTTDPQFPVALARSLPEDLSKLAVDLLRRNPEDRPSAREITTRVADQQERRRSAAMTLSRPKETPFIGRGEELAQLHEALAATERGTPVTVLVRGVSGMGKTALVRAFLHDAQQRDPSIVVFSGRSYEQESVPYKAVDSLIDDLARYLRRVSTLEAKALMPTDVATLARLFPVLQEVAPVQKARRKALEIPDSQELRRRAFAALRELMARMADERRIILFLDDVQWGDRDSAALLAEILRPPDAPPLLVIACHRSEEAESSPMLAELRKLRETEGALGDVRDVALEQLSADEARNLARSMLQDDAVAGGGSLDRAESIAREGAGSPFFIVELARFSDATGVVAAEVDGNGAVLDRLINARVGLLPEGGRELLEIVSVAGRPIVATAANAAANLRPDDEAMLARLRADHLLRTRVRGGRDEVDAYHDRIREAVVAALPADRRRSIHLTIARTLEEHGAGDPEVLAVHYLGGGEPAKAAGHALEAAERATKALAFENAAHFYGMALGLEGGEPRAELLTKLGDSLANAGRGADAAPYYFHAAKNADPATKLELMRRASEGLLRGGHVDEGLGIIREVLASIGLRIPPTPRAAVLGILASRLMLKLRGLKFLERPAEMIPQSELTRIDVLWAVVTGLARIDNIRSAYFQPIHLRVALATGEPYRAARALATEAAFSAVQGEKARKRTEQLVSMAERSAQKVGHPHAIGMSMLARSMESFYHGHFRDAFQRAEEAEAVFRERCTGVSWEIATILNYSHCSLMYLGEMAQLAQRVPQRLREAEDHGDLYAGIDPVSRPGIVYLAMDEPETGRRAVRQVMDRWSLQGFHFQHYLEMYAENQIDLYAGNWASAWRRVHERWPLMKSSFLLRIPFAKIEGSHLKGRSALAAAKGGGDRALIESAERDAKVIEKEHVAWALPLATSLRAGVASLRGQRDRAVELLERAERDFERAEMMLYAKAAALRRIALTGESSSAEEWMRQQGVKNPQRLLDVLVPGF
jgi:serine/threonine protein kinase